MKTDHRAIDLAVNHVFGSCGIEKCLLCIAGGKGEKGGKGIRKGWVVQVWQKDASDTVIKISFIGYYHQHHGNLHWANIPLIYSSIRSQIPCHLHFYHVPLHHHHFFRLSFSFTPDNYATRTFQSINILISATTTLHDAAEWFWLFQMQWNCAHFGRKRAVSLFLVLVVKRKAVKFFRTSRQPTQNNATVHGNWKTKRNNWNCHCGAPRWHCLSCCCLFVRMKIK